MLEFDGLKYTIWDVDPKELNDIYEKTNFIKNLQMSFQVEECLQYAPEAVHAASLAENILKKIIGINAILNIIDPYILDAIQGYKNSEKDEVTYKIIGGWANQLIKGSYGKIHKHHPYVDVVLIFYCFAPKDSANLVLVKSKHKDKIMSTLESIPEEDQLVINSQTGRCILHDAKILHAVTKHESNDIRNALIFNLQLYHRE